MSKRFSSHFFPLNFPTIFSLSLFLRLALSRSGLQLELLRVEQGLHQFQAQLQIEETVGGLNWDSGYTCFHALLNGCLWNKWKRTCMMGSLLSQQRQELGPWDCQWPHVRQATGSTLPGPGRLEGHSPSHHACRQHCPMPCQQLLRINNALKGSQENFIF